MATMNVSMPLQMKRWVEARVASGKYGNLSDYVRELIRRDMATAAEIAYFQKAIDEGDSSGYVPYSRAEIEASLGIAKD